MIQQSVASNLTIFCSPELVYQIQKLNSLVEKFPILIPVPECRKLMNISDEGLRRAILQKQITGAFWWRKSGKQNYAYRIQTLPFYNSYVGNLFPIATASKGAQFLINENGSRIFEKPSAIQSRIEALYRLVQAFLIHIPVNACSSFLGVSQEGLRRAIQLHNIPLAFCWKRPGKDNYGYRIQTIPFFAWEMGATHSVNPLLPQSNARIMEDD